MDYLQLMRERHSVRQYLDKPLTTEQVEKLRSMIAEMNEKTGLHMQLMLGSEGVYGNLLSKVIGWKNVPCYVAFIGKDTPENQELCGYYGEQLVLEAQGMGLNSCWAGMVKASAVTAAADVDAGEKLIVTLAIGYGANQGRERGGKKLNQVTDSGKSYPDWFVTGVGYALLAPTAINQQKFVFDLDADGNAFVKIGGKGPFVHVDLGIVRYQFELASGHPCKAVL